MAKKPIPKELLAPFVAEGKKAKAKGKPATACPYGMSKACTMTEVEAQIEARRAWMEGYHG